MVYYVRFLKTPRLQSQKAGPVTVTALICITTDLGDAFLAQDIDLQVILSSNGSGRILYKDNLQWKAGKRELPLSLGPFPARLSQEAIVLGVTAVDPQRPSLPSTDYLLDTSKLPLVISGWSAPFGGAETLVAEKLVERRFCPKDQLDLRIWEETGNSIARHIWDAAIASVMYLEQAITKTPGYAAPLLGSLLQGQRSTPLHAIELGSGCGIVGIALAELLSHCSVLLTDLDEVEEIVMKNIAVARPAPSSQVRYQTLDWDVKLPDDLCDGHIDLILVSDCTYNADSLPALANVLDRLVQMSPDAVVLVALKRRHDSEEVFFSLMDSVNLFSLHKDTMQLPSQHDQFDEIELYCYGRKDRHDAQHCKPIMTS
ncbi:protein-lysine methyltransferase C42C1.13 [Aspergillus lentulus]|uniref:Protein-lysine methyltransferase C42C1.13 n=1 Tax=Aspergillus lentulus TaxID=293939 RepID=A0AAN4PJT1_ASPLE|nr:protein-lysine methyltransferase C42C1.13 [Aspergillus lentulus]